jgi:hypothetical protein
VTGAAGIPVDDLAALGFLWRIGSFAPAVTGTAILVAPEGAQKENVSDGAPPFALRITGEGKVVTCFIGSGAGTAGTAGTAGRRLLSGNAVLVPEPLARRRGLSAGSELSIVAGGAPRRVTVAGILELTGVARASGGDLLITDLFTAQRLLGKEGRVDRVDVVLDPGVPRAEAAKTIAARLPPGLTLEPPGPTAAADRMVRAFASTSSTRVAGPARRRLPDRERGVDRGPAAPPDLGARAIGCGRAASSRRSAPRTRDRDPRHRARRGPGFFASRWHWRRWPDRVRILLRGARRGAAYGGAVVLSAAVGLATSLATATPGGGATRVEPAPALRPARQAVSGGAWWGARRSRGRARGGGGVRRVGSSLCSASRRWRWSWRLAFAAPLAVRLARPPGRILGRSLGPRAASPGFFGGASARGGTAVAALAMRSG